MKREIHKWYSPSLFKDMEIAVYGHYGTPLLMFPTAGADFLEYERFQLIDSISWFINEGKFKVFSINSINNESWLNNSIYQPHKSLRHGQYNQYIIEEVVPFIYNNCSSIVPIITTGASLGAYHAANTFFRSPSVFRGTIAMSGVYDLKYYAKGYYDDHVYFNSPIDFLPNSFDENYLNQMRNNLGIIIASGQGEFEDPSSSIRLSNILNSKNIQHWLDLWGFDVKHDWPTWRNMLPYFLSKF
ncbi:MAG: esterase family protein [Ignavibacteriales bacterium]|nr:esterase family protein [Ignavibacteriales bacterium]